MKILFLTECGEDIGFGHLTRCQSIAQASETFGAIISFVVSVRGMKPQLPDNSQIHDWYEPTPDILSLIDGSSLVIIDSYVVTQLQVANILKSHPVVAVIDDYHRRTYHQGIIIDWTVGAESYAYSDKMSGVRYLLGSKYCALRSAFWQGTQVRKYLPGIARILITLGGSDVKCLTGPVIYKLMESFPDTALDVVIGPGVRDHTFVHNLKRQNVLINFGCDDNEMRALMETADIAICGGGQTLYEMAATGLPPIVVQLIENQQDDVREFARIGFATSVGRWDDPMLFENLVKKVHHLTDPDARSTISSIGQNEIDGQGVFRLVEELFSFVKSSTPHAV
jgi:UDP-2,4-diacetamido-2,4,6-trideoxy-beta-L-altropyranose hydrolase